MLADAGSIGVGVHEEDRDARESQLTGELKKVSFPTRAETVGATTVVIVFCILMSLYLSMMDSVLGWLMRKVI